MKKTHYLLLAVSVSSLLAASSASATIKIDTVRVGDAGNAPDTTGFGGVSYNYRIGTYEVTNSQYAAFLNAKAGPTDPHGLYQNLMGSDTFFGGITNNGGGSFSVKPGFENKPVNYVSFWGAARFSNWLTNGQGSGDTETGVYVLTLTGIIDNTITRDATAWNAGGVAIASENEWYKAAYYDGNGSYFDYPTQSNTAPTATVPNSINANSANFNFVADTLTDVGSYTLADSHYGTFDQGGNLSEWNDEVIGNDRGLRGGSLVSVSSQLQSSSRNSFGAPSTSDTVGFRVSSLAPIPEPSAYAAILGCLGLGLALMRRRGRA